MIYISGAFVYQPPHAPRPGVSSPATYLIKVVIRDETGLSVFDAESDLDRLKAVVVLGYPQTFIPGGYPLALTRVEGLGFPGQVGEVLQLLGVYDETFLGFPLPPLGWMPAAILILVDGMWGTIIQAAAPAVADSGLAPLVDSGPPPAE